MKVFKSRIATIASLLILGSTSLTANVDIFVKDGKISYDTVNELGTLKTIYIYKNGRFIQTTNTLSGFINDTDSAKYQVIAVMLKDGKTSYISTIKDITLGAKNILPVAELEMSLSGNILTFNNTGSYDADGTLSSRGFYIYDTTGKLLKSVNGVNGTYDFNTLSVGKYQIISYVIDNNGDKVAASRFFDISGGPNYATGISSNLLQNTNQLNYTYSFHSRLGTQTAYSQGWTGQGVKVAILDSGIDYNHPELKDNIISVNSVLTYSDAAKAGYDDNKHGTMVAGVIGAAANDIGVVGVAYDADLISVKVTSSNGTGTFNGIADGLRIATSKKAKVTNMSLGGLGYYNNDYATSAYKEAIQNDNSIIVAAGNFNKECTNISGVISGCSYPAVLPIYYPELLNGNGAFIVVGSVDKNGNKANYSSSAGIMKDYFMVAPGGNVSTTEFIYTTAPGGNYTHSYGTSFATPMVTGAFALLAQKYPYLKGNDIKNILFASATDLGATGVDNVFGHGLLNVDKAMQPIGTLKLPTSKSVSGASQTPTSTSIATSASMNLNLNLDSVLVLDSYNRGYNTKIQKTKYEDISYTKDDFSIIDGVYGTNFIVGFDEHKQNIIVGYKAFEDDDNSLKFLISRENTVFGSEGTGATDMSGNTYYSTLEYNYKNLEVSLTHGYSKPEYGGYFKNMTAVQGFGADINYSFGNFKIGTELPMRVQKGKYSAEVPTARADNGDIVSELTNSSFKAETDYNVYFKYEMNF